MTNNRIIFSRDFLAGTCSQNNRIQTIFTAHKVCEGYVFTGVCLSTRGEYLGRYPLTGTTLGRYNPLGRYTPSWAGTPPAGTPQGRYIPWAGTPPPGQVHPPGGYTPQAGTPLHHIACWNTVNKRTVRIPLECILVIFENTRVFPI